jgi:hypothetical protein
MESAINHIALFGQAAADTATTGSPFWEIFGIWIAAILTLAMYSFLYKDNPVYKFGEHLYLGTSVGYLICLTWYNVMWPNLFEKLFKDFGFYWYLILPGILGACMLFRFSRTLSWVSRYSLAWYVGDGAGLAIPALIQANLLRQMYATFVPLWGGVTGTELIPVISAIISFVGVFSVLIYFFFSLEHKGVIGRISQIGIWFLMITFGASFGYTVMARITLLIGRMQFLLGNWLHIIPKPDF